MSEMERERGRAGGRIGTENTETEMVETKTGTEVTRDRDKAKVGKQLRSRAWGDKGLSYVEKFKQKSLGIMHLRRYSLNAAPSTSVGTDTGLGTKVRIMCLQYDIDMVLNI